MTDNLQTVLEPDWAEICPGCAGDIGRGDVVVLVSDGWRHEDCASQQTSIASAQRFDATQPMQVPAQYTASVRTRVVPDPTALAAIVPNCHITADGAELVAITYPAPTSALAHVTALALAQTMRGQLGDVACLGLVKP